MTECNHRSHAHEFIEGAYRCLNCQARICTDCGSAEQHRDAFFVGYCRRCAEKGGHRYAFVTEIDHDKLRELLHVKFGRQLGEELVDRILRECRP